MRFGREWLILTGFTLMVWQLLYVPLGLIMGFGWEQWLVWLSIGSIYDVLAAYPISKVTIMFNGLAKSRGWY